MRLLAATLLFVVGITLLVIGYLAGVIWLVGAALFAWPRLALIDTPGERSTPGWVERLPGAVKWVLAASLLWVLIIGVGFTGAFVAGGGSWIGLLAGASMIVFGFQALLRL